MKKETSSLCAVVIVLSVFCESETLMSEYRRFITSCVSAVSTSLPPAAIIVSPANCPALVRFVKLMQTAARTGSPAAEACMPNAKDTAR